MAGASGDAGLLCFYYFNPGHGHDLGPFYLEFLVGVERHPAGNGAGRLVIAKGFYQDGILEAQQVSVRAHEETVVE